jgi:hypothetical protein
MLMNAAAAFGRRPDDSGYYTNLGAQRLMETGLLPYADTLLKGPEAPGYGAAATYGPLLYLSHVPFQWLLGPEDNPPDANPKDASYVRPPHLATQLVTYLYFLAGVLALCLVVGGLAGPELGLSAGILYAASPYVVGLGGQEYFISGMTYLSHLAPSAVLMLALLAIPRPFVSGLLFAASAGVLFYPVFMFPLWFGWWFWKKRGAIPFTAGCIVGGLLIAGFVVAFTPGNADAGSISLFLESTLDHQEGVGDQRYGLSAFGFWGTHPRLASFWQVPLIGEGVLFKPIFMAFAALCAASFFFARGRSVPQLEALTAMLAAAVQLWKSHAAGSYVEWFLPFLIVALLGMGGRDPHLLTEEEGDA